MIGPNRAEHKIFVLGEKGNAALRRPYPDILFAGVSYIALPINFMAAASIAHKIEQAAEDCDEMVIMYKQFKIVCRHEAEEPEKFFSENYFYELYVASTLYHALLNTRTTEEASRMNAMENASKNAKEMLEKITL